MTQLLMSLSASGFFSALDFRLAEALGRVAGAGDPLVLLGAALASRQVRLGHSCVDLARCCGAPIADEEGAGVSGARWPAAEEWMVALRSSALVASPGRTAPLVLDETGRLYLARYAAAERRLAEEIAGRAATGFPDVDDAALARSLDRLFPLRDGDPDADQRRATEAAVRGRFTVVSGGPGTGKTTVAIAIVRALVDQAAAVGRRPPRILLLAPTGKAAARLAEVVRTSDGAERAAGGGGIPAGAITGATTIHRALGAARDPLFRFRHGPEDPLLADAVIVDEASMVDLSLMARIASATTRDARLILLGDRHQLASVEAGAVMADICDVAANRQCATLSERFVELVSNRRYAATSGVGELARAICAGDATGALERLARGAFSGVVHVDWMGGEPPAALRGLIHGFCDACLTPVDPGRALERFGALRLLTAHRRGSRGADGLNELVQQVLGEAGSVAGGEEWYAGRPVIVTENDYDSGLNNGDLGVAASIGAGAGELRIFFSAPDGALRSFAPTRLPAHETAWAMTVHKSQGSEVDHVALVLPERRSPVTTRELIYTAVTRARARVTIFGSLEILGEAVDTPVERSSGLKDRLLEAHAALRPPG